MADPGSVFAVLTGTRLFMQTEVTRIFGAIAEIDRLLAELSAATGVDRSVDKTEAGFVAPRPVHRWSEQDEELRSLALRGLKAAEIAFRLGRTTGAIYRRMRTLGLVKKHRKRPPVDKSGENAERVSTWPAETANPMVEPPAAAADGLFPRAIDRRCVRCRTVFKCRRTSETVCKACLGPGPGR